MYASPAENLPSRMDRIIRGLDSVDLFRSTIVCGDFNCPVDKPSNTGARQLLETLQLRGFWLASERAEHTFIGPQGKSTIDLFFTNIPEDAVEYLGTQKHLKAFGARWHLPVALEVRALSPRTQMPRRPRIPAMLDIASMVQNLPRILPVPTSISIEDYACDVSEFIRRSVVQSPPTRSITWFSPECHNAKRFMLQAYVLFKACDYMYPMYVAASRSYKRALREAKNAFAERAEAKLIQEAQRHPYKWLRADLRATACPVPSTVLQDHFGDMFASSHTIPSQAPLFLAAWPSTVYLSRALLDAPFSIEEVARAMLTAQRKKAPGHDSIRNEHLNQAVVAAPCITALFNEVQRSSTLPRSWLESLLSVIPKGKGNPLEPSSYRGIAKKNTLYKLMSSILNRRLDDFLECENCLPEEQHGFRRDRSTYSAATILLHKIRRSLARDKLPLYAVFVDFRAAFDTASRSLILEKLGRFGVSELSLKLIHAILQSGTVVLDDGVSELEPITQTTGVAQGDPLSSTLFSVLVSDLPGTLKTRHSQLDVLMYADDLVIFSNSRFHLNRSLSTLEKYVSANSLEINVAKTKAMKFRRGGRLASDDRLQLGPDPLEFVNHFSYLGITFSRKGDSFTSHVQERTRKGHLAFHSIRDPHKLALATAMVLFELKIEPTASYGVPVIWANLKASHFMELDRLRATFIKRALGVHRSSRNRIAFLIAGVPLLAEDLQRKYNLPKTDAYTEHLRTWESRRKSTPTCSKQRRSALIVGRNQTSRTGI